MKAGALGADWSHARPTAAQLKANGIEFAFRYVLDVARDGGKRLTREEALGLSAIGVEIGANFEYTTGGMAGGRAQGAQDATTAAAEMRAIGVPAGRPCYFSNDTSAVALAAVVDYLAGAAPVMAAAGYQTGVYGGRRTIDAAYAAGCRWLWQTYAWSDLNGDGVTEWHPAATVRQVHNGAFPGVFDGDLDVAMKDDIGSWTIGVSMADTRVPDDLVSRFPAELGIKTGWTITEDRRAWLAYLSTTQAASAAGKALSLVTSVAGQVAKLQGVDQATLDAVKAAQAEVAQLVDAVHTLPGVDPQAQADAALNALRDRLES